MDLLQFYNCLSLLSLVVSPFAIIGLHLVNRSRFCHSDAVREIQMVLERTNPNCKRTKLVVVETEPEARHHDAFGCRANVIHLDFER